jgi:hypothetical protein
MGRGINDAREKIEREFSKIRETTIEIDLLPTMSCKTLEAKAKPLLKALEGHREIRSRHTGPWIVESPTESAETIIEAAMRGLGFADGTKKP